MRSLLFVLFALISFQSFAQSDTIKTASGLRYVILQKGNGPFIHSGSKVSVHYSGWLLNGTRFDTSEGGSPITIKAGTGEVIKGWDEILLLLRQGDKVNVLIPANLAYGENGVLDPEVPGSYTIPPDAPLKFQLKIESVKP